MTYGLGLFLQQGFVVTADTRTSAGPDNIATIRKLSLFQDAGNAIMVLSSAGNLATTQAVVSLLEQRLNVEGNPNNLFAALTMFDAASMVGNVLREVMGLNAQHVQSYGDPSASFVFAGQIAGGPHRVYLIYSAGNFVEATVDTPYVQIGEFKYGKPILDRALSHAETSIGEGIKLSLLSFDATIRSNVTVAPPFDMVCYRADSLEPVTIRRFEKSDDYYYAIRRGYADVIRDAVANLPLVEWPGVVDGPAANG